MRANDRRRQFGTDGLQTASAERVVILLYERLERDLGEAHLAIAAGETEPRHRALMHAQQIIEELSYALRPDMWDGAESLMAIYHYLLDRLVEANIEPSTAKIETIQKMISELATAWRSAYETLAPEVASA